LADTTRKRNAQDISHEQIKKRARYLYPKVLEALNNQLRRDILDLLVQNPAKRWSFSEIKAAFPGLKNASLAHHLQVLQIADLVERTVRLEERRLKSDPYYCFYSITRFGEYVNQCFLRDVEKGLELATAP